MNSDFLVFIDLALKNQDKDFYQKTVSYGQLNNWRQVEEVKYPHVLPAIFFLSASTDIESFKFGESDIQINLKGSNLDLFTHKLSGPNEFEVTSFESFIDLYPVILDYLYVIKCQAIDELRPFCNQNLKNMSTKAKIGKNVFDVESFIKFQDLFFESVPRRETFFFDINNLITSAYGERVKLIPWHKARDFKDNIIDFSLPELNDNYIYWEGRDINPILCYHFINDIYKLKYKDFLYEKNISNWSEILTSISTPFVFYDSFKVPLLYNQKFTNLNLSVAECYDYTMGKIILNNDVKYKIIKTQGDNESTLCLFLGHKSEEYSTSYTDELGIITSSIAHELNNPLAGILAALDVLLLDEFDDETQAELQEMKSGVSRARKLVMTFLGFSKSSNTSVELEGNLGDSFTQAIELTRARLIENNLKLEYHFQGGDPRSIKVSESFMTMLFYLLIGEAITVLQRKALVENQRSDRVEIIVNLEGRKLSLLFPNHIETYNRCKESKLFIYMLRALDFSLDSSENQLRFIRTSSEI